MPILDITLSRPSSMAWMKLLLRLLLVHRQLARVRQGAHACPARGTDSPPRRRSRRAARSGAPRAPRPSPRTRPVCMRMPSRTSRWCTADSASSAGMAACAASTPRSLSTRMLAPVVHRLHRRGAQPLDRRLQRALAPVHRVQQARAACGSNTPSSRMRGQLRELPVGEDRARQRQPVALLRRLLEGVAVRAQRRWRASSPATRGWDRWAGWSPARRAGGSS